MASSTMQDVLFPSSRFSVSEIDSLCIGSGRFLRSVLVPALIEAGMKPAIIQARGTSLLEFMKKSNNRNVGALTYEVDTVGYDGKEQTDKVSCYGVGTLGTKAGKKAVMDLLENMKTISVIGIGVSEAGLASPKSQVLIDLVQILNKCHSLMTYFAKLLRCNNPNGRINIINTDNVPGNGRLIRMHVFTIAKSLDKTVIDYVDDSYKVSFLRFLKEKITFHDTMVDRITHQRDGSDGMVPRCEPVPSKALVIQDLYGDLPKSFMDSTMTKKFGVVIRSKKGQLDGDIALKLRVANGTHTAAAHPMALAALLNTDELSLTKSKHVEKGKLIMKYLDAFFESQILPGAEAEYGADETKAVYADWRKRLCHPHFGLSTFFVTQNGAVKAGIRISPTIRSLLRNDKPVTAASIFAIATILRFLTPVWAIPSHLDQIIYKGWLDGWKRSHISKMEKTSDNSRAVTYADGLCFSIENGWYEFRCDCNLAPDDAKKSDALPEFLAAVGTAQQPECYESIIRAYMLNSDGGDLFDIAMDPLFKSKFDAIVRSITTIHARMISGDGVLALLQEMVDKKSCFVDGLATNCNELVDGVSLEQCNDSLPLHFRSTAIPDYSNLMKLTVGTDRKTITSVIFSEVSSVRVIDLHTHLLPPSHGALCLWGIDELLTYHYLVAEYFMTAPVDIVPEDFFAKSKQTQANMIWQALFIDRSPVSEACRGVLTTLQKLGFTSEIEARDLKAIRSYYDTFRSDGEAGADRFSDLVFELAGVRYAVMTNVPFDVNESQHWRSKRKGYSDHYKSSLRVDPLVAGDNKALLAALTSSGYKSTLKGAREYLREWCDTMKPEYMMASTPHNFKFGEGGPLADMKKTGVNEDSMKQPFAFVDLSNADEGCNPEEDATASIINEKSDLLSEVLMKVCEERDLPVALKIGAHRAVNPNLAQAGDGVVAFADAGVLARLCTRFPKVRFLATFLSRNNQHEACVIASKFRNLHIYGAWWFCNNPSIIRDITTMRVEMLGTAFTAQHSDARVLDQLIYKWSHSRAVIAKVLAEEYVKLSQTGWVPTREEVRRDIERLFGTSYEEFMAKSFA